MFSGGSYREVERWLWNFLASHAKRVNPRIEVALDAGDAREGRSYGARLRLGGRTNPLGEFEFAEVAANRERLAWCAALAERTKGVARELAGDTGAADARAR